MKSIKFILVTLILISLFAACEPLATFTGPQPTNVKDLLKIPKKLQGKYLSLSDSSILIIDDKIVQTINISDTKIHLNELDSTLKLIGDTLINLKNNKKHIVKYDGDSLIVHLIDTLFQMSSDNVVRKFKGYYFANIRYDENAWITAKVQLTKNQLIICNISTKEELEKLYNITETLQDTILPHNFEVTKQQFGKFVKNGGFNDCEVYVKFK